MGHRPPCVCVFNSKPHLSPSGVRVLVDAREKLQIPWGSSDNQVHGDNVMSFDTRSSMMVHGQVETSVFLKYLPSIQALWADVAIQHAYDRRREFQLVSTHTHAQIHTQIHQASADWLR